MKRVLCSIFLVGLFGLFVAMLLSVEFNGLVVDFFREYVAFSLPFFNFINDNVWVPFLNSKPLGDYPAFVVAGVGAVLIAIIYITATIIERRRLSSIAKAIQLSESKGKNIYARIANDSTPLKLVTSFKSDVEVRRHYETLAIVDFKANINGVLPPDEITVSKIKEILGLERENDTDYQMALFLGEEVEENLIDKETVKSTIFVDLNKSEDKQIKIIEKYEHVGYEDFDVSKYQIVDEKTAEFRIVNTIDKQVVGKYRTESRKVKEPDRPLVERILSEGYFPDYTPKYNPIRDELIAEWTATRYTPTVREKKIVFVQEITPELTETIDQIDDTILDTEEHDEINTISGEERVEEVKTDDIFADSNNLFDEDFFKSFDFKPLETAEYVEPRTEEIPLPNTQELLVPSLADEIKAEELEEPVISDQVDLEAEPAKKESVEDIVKGFNERYLDGEFNDPNYTTPVYNESVTNPVFDEDRVYDANYLGENNPKIGNSMINPNPSTVTNMQQDFLEYYLGTNTIEQFEDPIKEDDSEYEYVEVDVNDLTDEDRQNIVSPITSDVEEIEQLEESEIIPIEDDILVNEFTNDVEKQYADTTDELDSILNEPIVTGIDEIEVLEDNTETEPVYEDVHDVEEVEENEFNRRYLNGDYNHDNYDTPLFDEPVRKEAYERDPDLYDANARDYQDTYDSNVEQSNLNNQVGNFLRDYVGVESVVDDHVEDDKIGESEEPVIENTYVEPTRTYEESSRIDEDLMSFEKEDDGHLDRPVIVEQVTDDTISEHAEEVAEPSEFERRYLDGEYNHDNYDTPLFDEPISHEEDNLDPDSYDANARDYQNTYDNSVERSTLNNQVDNFLEDYAGIAPVNQGANDLETYVEPTVSEDYVETNSIEEVHDNNAELEADHSNEDDEFTRRYLNGDYNYYYDDTNFKPVEIEESNTSQSVERDASSYDANARDYLDNRDDSVERSTLNNQVDSFLAGYAGIEAPKESAPVESTPVNTVREQETKAVAPTTPVVNVATPSRRRRGAGLDEDEFFEDVNKKQTITKRIVEYPFVTGYRPRKKTYSSLEEMLDDEPTTKRRIRASSNNNK